MEFFLVYIREAHPMGEPDRRGRVGIRKEAPGGGGHGAIPLPKTEEERHAAAKKCVDGLELSIPTLVDSMDNAANYAYGAWPDRMYVIGVDGNIAYGGEPGPWGFDAEAWAAAIHDVAK